MTTLFVSAKSLRTFLDLKDIGKVKTLISFDIIDEKTVQQIIVRGISLLSFIDLVKEG